MADSAPSLTPVPAHVPHHLVRDFDVYRPLRTGLGYFESFKAAQDEGLPDLFWSPYNGGHWIVSRKAMQNEVFGDLSRFTSERGLVAPTAKANAIKLMPIEADPPRQTKYRALFASAFTALAIKKLEEGARQMAIDLTEGLKSRGACEFVTDFAQHLPIKIFMEMVDIPESDRLKLLPLANAQVEADAPKSLRVGQELPVRVAQIGQQVILEIQSSEPPSAMTCW